jgi:hypothetical protein
MYPTMSPEMLQGAAQTVVLFFSIVVAVLSSMLAARA